MDRLPALAKPTAPPPALESTDSGRDAVTIGNALLSGVSEDFGFGGHEQGGDVSPGDDPWLGCEVGGVRLKRLVGSGGMGRVYEAAQVNPARRVAVKLARPESLTEATARRLHREADVLATLEHPGIARIHSAGTHPLADGCALPFMVIEFVPDALPITEWCRAHQLDQSARIETLLQVCDAVSHAHDRGIVHRDLKPGNILVDGDGRPRLVDFGIASWVAPSAPTLSVGGRITGTPAYMSPEQREGAAVDARTDVYALGLLAAELLTDQSPMRAQVAIAGRRDPLARIVKRCLEIDAEDRYGSVRDFATALRSHLNRHRAPQPRQTRPIRLMVWAGLLTAELVVLSAIGMRGWFATPISQPVFRVDGSESTDRARPLVP